MKLRPYQDRCVNAVFDALGSHRSALVDMATGLGKTVIFSHVADRWPGRVLIMAHRDELIRQAADKVQAITGVRPGIEMAGERVYENGGIGRPKVVIASVQTLTSGDRLAKFDPSQFGLVITDEAHRGVAKSYRRVFAYFDRNPDSRRLGVTATPLRADQLALGQVFETVAFRYPIEDGIADGWLVPVAQHAVHVDGLDFSRLRTIAGDFHEGELEKILTEEAVLHKVAAPVVELAGSRPTLVFCCSVKHAELMAAVLNRYKSHSAEFLCGASDPSHRAERVQAFRAGRLQFLCNCLLMTEGFDAPPTALVVMARPTKSLSLYCQLIGRGTRPLPGVVDGIETPQDRRAAIACSDKPGLLVLDFVGNSGRHQIVTALDVLGGKYGTPVRDYAKETVAAEQRETPVAEALDRAERELTLDADQEEYQRRRHITAEADYRTREVSPFGGSVAPAVAEQKAPRGEPATDKQVRYLCFLGVPYATAKAYTKRQAGAVIDSILKKREEGRGS